MYMYVKPFSWCTTRGYWITGSIPDIAWDRVADSVIFWFFMTFPEIGVIFPPGNMTRKLTLLGNMTPKYDTSLKNMTPRAVEVGAVGVQPPWPSSAPSWRLAPIKILFDRPILYIRTHIPSKVPFDRIKNMTKIWHKIWHFGSKSSFDGTPNMTKIWHYLQPWCSAHSAESAQNGYAKPYEILSSDKIRLTWRRGCHETCKKNISFMKMTGEESLLVYVNGERHELERGRADRTLLQFLRGMSYLLLPIRVQYGYF